MGRKWEVGYKREMWMIGEDGDKSGEKKVVGNLIEWKVYEIWNHYLEYCVWLLGLL